MLCKKCCNVVCDLGACCGASGICMLCVCVCADSSYWCFRCDWWSMMWVRSQ